MNAQPAILSLAMLAVFALALGGGWLLAKRGDRRRALLMLAAAAVLLVNVLLWAWPLPARAAAPLPAKVHADAVREQAVGARTMRSGSRRPNTLAAGCGPLAWNGS